jgi:hypothetical protein
MNEIILNTTSNANLDLFTQLVRGINKNDLVNYLDKSWDLSKIKTLAIIFNSRDRLKGKKEKEISNFCLLWLKHYHNEIYKKHILIYINEYGCWNDLNYIIKKTKNHNYEYKLFAEQLKKDKELLEDDKNISLCAKWVISPNHKKIIKIARYLFDDIKNYQEKYRKEYISPLRKKLDIIESKLCNKDWEQIDYSKIPAKALSIYKKCFIKNDNDKYSTFLSDVANNKIKLKISGLLPHEIIKKYYDSDLNNIDETLELEWKAFVDIYRNKEDFNGIIPIVDVSGSMFDSSSSVKPIYVSIALGLLISELNSGYLHNKIMTFSRNPKFVNVQGETLRDKIKYISSVPFGLNTDFLKVADLIIATSLLDPSFSYKKIICLTDMQFDTANGNNNYLYNNEGDETTMNSKNIHENFINKFKNSGLDIPELIYWNLSSKYNNFPIDINYENTSIVSGFSEQLLTVILNNDKINPLSLMEQILEPYYKNILI